MSEDKPFQNAVKIQLINGEEVVLPRLTIGKIMEVTDSMNVLMESAKEKAPQVFDMFTGKDSENVGVKLVQVLPSLLPILMTQIVDLLSKYLGKDTQYIKDNMDMEDLVKILTPFFGDILKQGNHLLGPLSQALQNLNNPSPQPLANSLTSSPATTDGPSRKSKT